MTFYAFKLHKSLIRLDWQKPSHIWILNDEFSKWCDENLKKYTFAFIGNESSDEKLWSSYYWLIVEDVSDATLLRLFFPETVKIIDGFQQ